MVGHDHQYHTILYEATTFHLSLHFPVRLVRDNGEIKVMGISYII